MRKPSMNKYKFIIIWAIFLNILSSGFSMALDPEINVVIKSPTTPVICGTTNLPDGTKFLITIKNQLGNYQAQSHATVKNGAFKSNKFSKSGAQLETGKYSVEVLMPVPGVQSGSVRKIIGSKGEKLGGPLVKHGTLGKVVELMMEFNVVQKGNPERKIYKSAHKIGFKSGYEGGKQEKEEGYPFEPEVVFNQPFLIAGRTYVKQINGIPTAQEAEWDKGFREGFWSGFKSGYYGSMR